MSVPVAVLSWHDTQTEEMNRANDNESCDFVYFFMAHNNDLRNPARRLRRMCTTV